MQDIPDAKESGLSHLCEFIEDCEFTYLSTQILHLLGGWQQQEQHTVLVYLSRGLTQRRFEALKQPLEMFSAALACASLNVASMTQTMIDPVFYACVVNV